VASSRTSSILLSLLHRWFLRPRDPNPRRQSTPVPPQSSSNSRSKRPPATTMSGCLRPVQNPRRGLCPRFISHRWVVQDHGKALPAQRDPTSMRYRPTNPTSSRHRSSSQRPSFGPRDPPTQTRPEAGYLRLCGGWPRRRDKTGPSYPGAAAAIRPSPRCAILALAVTEPSRPGRALCHNAGFGFSVVGTFGIEDPESPVSLGQRASDNRSRNAMGRRRKG
jgi:hypothetical protein